MSRKEQQQVVYHLLSADDYWKALCSIKAIDQALSGIGEKEIVGQGPQTDVAVSLLDLLNDFEDKEFPEVWDDFETAVPSGADHEFRTIGEEIDDGLRADGSGEPSVEELVERELRRVQGVARKIDEDPDDLSGAMIIIANDEGIETYPYVAADEDPREMSLWMLGAFMAHVADSASGASGRQMRPIEAAQHAARIINDPEPDRRGDRDA